MKKIRVEVQSTLTYKPFENISDLLKKNEKTVEDKKHDEKQRS